MAESAQSRTPIAAGEMAARLLALIEELAAEIHPRQDAVARLSLDSSLDREVGLDSLGRVELLARIERQLGVALPEAVIGEAQTVGDLLSAMAETRAAWTGPPTDRPTAAEVKPSDALPQQATTLTEVFAWHVATHPDRTHITLLKQDGAAESITYGQLYEEAQGIASSLQGYGLRPRECVAIMLPTARDYFRCFMGVLLAGGIPVPVYPPVRASQLEDHVRRHRAILDNCQAVMLITVGEARGLARLLQAQTDSLRRVLSPDELEARSTVIEAAPIAADDIAFLQYTSGSTGNPKGVVLTHANLLANVRAAGRALQADASDCFVSWLPLYHDMGLIGAWFGTLYHATRLVIMSPLMFLTRPERWLWAIHRYGGTISAAPNFAYELCLRRIEEADLEGLDLSTWRAALNGAEPVNPTTIERFCERFRAYGLRREIMAPVYGLAEGTLAVAMPPLGRGPLIDRIGRRAFMEEGHAVPVAGADATSLQFVACGPPIEGHEVRVVDEAGRELPERSEGRLQFRGPSATRGYYRNSEATHELIKGEWLDPGDLAYIAKGEVYITGRTKDVVIRAGRNIYPHEIEERIGEIAGIRRGRVAAFGCPDPSAGTERLVIIAETQVSDAEARTALWARINEVVTDLSGGAPDDVVLAPPGTVLKTSSGKIRRGASRELYQRGEIGKAAPPVWIQVARMASVGLSRVVRRAGRRMHSTLYALYAWSVLGLMAPVVWTLVVLAPRLEWRWVLMRAAARGLARATVTPCTVGGLERLPPPGRPVVYVANHASYLDAYFLVGFVPRIVSIVAKAELRKAFTMRIFLERIGTEFVERFDKQQGIADARRAALALSAGRSLLFFPEGTFSRVPGVLPFQMGAFIAAAETNSPVVPLLIQGTRDILRDDSWLPARGRVSITVGPPLECAAVQAAAGADPWKTALQLRDRTRQFMLEQGREPDLARRR
jgi:1-acyl-sn-glycerol-3-phosphate acyltransferase